MHTTNIHNVCSRKMLAIVVSVSIAASTGIGQIATGRDRQIKTAQARSAFAQAQQFVKQGSAESMRSSLPKFEQARFLYRELGDKQLEAHCLVALGFVYDNLDEKQKALEYYHQAIPLLKTVGDKHAEAVTLNNLGKVYSNLGQRQKSLEYYTQALPIRKTVGDISGEATTLHNIGGVYNDLGEKQEALDYFLRALPLRRAAGDKRGEATTLTSIGVIYDDRDEEQKALEYFNQALPLRRAAGDIRGEATTLSNIALVYSELGEDRKALEYYARALPLQRESGNKRGEATTLTGIGGVFYDLGDNQRALQFNTQALLLSKSVGARSGESTAFNNLMHVWKALKNDRLAVFYGKQAVNAYQELRYAVQGLEKETQQTYLRTVQNTYRTLTGILISQDRLSEAQQTLNAFKDQQFFDFHKDAVPQEQISLALTPREKEFFERYKTAGKNTTTFGEEVVAVLKHAESDFSKPLDAKDRVGEVRDTAQMQSALRALAAESGQKAVAVYLLLGIDTFRAVIVSPNDIKSVSVPVKAADLNQKASKLWSLLQTDKYDVTKSSKKLYDIVFKSIEPQLPKDTSTIMWSLDGNLRYIPMAALFDGNRFLAERYRNVLFTRADKEGLTRADSRVWTGTGLGSTQAHILELSGERIAFNALPGVSGEMRAIFKQPAAPKGIFAGEVLPDAKFTRANFLTAMKQKRPLVHIASHFAFRAGDESRSFLLLGDGSAFTLEEMKEHKDLFAGVELLTLSACNTAAQQAGANGREVDAFAELAQRLGAGSVLASLWAVADESTSLLMAEFYRLKKANPAMTKAEALQVAQKAMIEGRMKSTGNGSGCRSETFILGGGAAAFKCDANAPFSHPYFWSPFVLIGNWK